MTVDAAWLAFTSAILAAVLTQVLTLGREWWMTSRTTKAQRSYASLRLAIILEKFAVDCAEYISDNDLCTSSDGNAGQSRTTLPDITSYPDTIEWRSLSSEMAERVLSFRSEVGIADRHIQFWWEIEPEHVPAACDEQCGKCGYRAWLLASDLRRAGGLPQTKLRDFAWDFVDLLRKTSERCERRERAETRAS